MTTSSATPLISMPKYKITDRVVVNYGPGLFDNDTPNITFTIDTVSANHGAIGAHRYWGCDARGQAHGAYEDQIIGIAPL